MPLGQANAGTTVGEEAAVAIFGALRRGACAATTAARSAATPDGPGAGRSANAGSTGDPSATCDGTASRSSGGGSGIARTRRTASAGIRAAATRNETKGEQAGEDDLGVHLL